MSNRINVRIPKFVITANDDRVERLISKHCRFDVPPDVLHKALNAVSKGVIRLGLDPKYCTMSVAVNDRQSPALEELTMWCGTAEVACAILYLKGAPIDGDAYQQIRTLVATPQ